MRVSWSLTKFSNLIFWGNVAVREENWQPHLRSLRVKGLLHKFPFDFMCNYTYQTCLLWHSFLTCNLPVTWKRNNISNFYNNTYLHGTEHLCRYNGATYLQLYIYSLRKTQITHKMEKLCLTTLHVTLNTTETRWSMSNFPCIYFQYLENSE